MSLDKAIEHGKEKRKPYRGSKAIDRSCRNHGGCTWCECTRLYQRKRTEEASRIELASSLYETCDKQRSKEYGKLCETEMEP